MKALRAFAYGARVTTTRLCVRALPKRGVSVMAAKHSETNLRKKGDTLRLKLNIIHIL